MPHILYLVHDLADPAVRRRVIMFRRGGASVDLIGFCRATMPREIEGVTPISLGKTADGRFVQRCLAVIGATMRLQSNLSGLRRPDVIVGRNLETLALANRANAIFGGAVPIIYECLDIHRLLLQQGLVGHAMRLSERWFGRRVKAIMTSSPAFKTHYFDRLSQLRSPVFLVENKVIGLSNEKPVPAGPSGEQRPWRIGWFGALRCRKSLQVLSHFSRMANGRFEIILRGRPAYSEFDDFDALIAAEPHMRFEGPYRNPEDLGAIYGEVDFAWAIDCFEEGFNSKWLLPNRLYEGCLHGAIPIAVSGTETATVLERNRIGLVLSEVTPFALAEAVKGLDFERVRQLTDAVVACDQHNWMAGEAECRDLVAWLSSFPQSEPYSHIDPRKVNSSFAV